MSETKKGLIIDLEMIGEEDRNFDSVELSDLIEKSTEILNDLEK